MLQLRRHGLEIDLHRRQNLAKVVVKLDGDAPPLFFLDRQQAPQKRFQPFAPRLH